MKLKDLVPNDAQIKLVQGVESELLSRQRTGALAGMVGALALVVQVIAALPEDSSYLDNIGELVLHPLAYLRNPANLPELVGVVVVVLALAIYVLARRTGFLFRQSTEPFRYTFWIDVFQPAVDPGEDDPDTHARLQMLHHDLMERLNQRIARFSLLNLDALEDREGPASHIQIGGVYAVRENKDGLWELQVMPQVRIGITGRPITLAQPVRYPLGVKTDKELTPQRYVQLVERVYSRIATEVYRRLERDVREKLRLFPTSYLRAAALSYEAEDFARSNTVDAYERAIDLYRQSLSYFRVSAVAPIADVLVLIPGLWRVAVGFQHLRARVQIGFAKCLVYRRVISTLSGRERNPLYEGRAELSAALASLAVVQRRITGRLRPATTPRARLAALMAYLTFPRDSWRRLLPSHRLFQEHTQIEFDAHVVAALTFFYLDALERADRELQDARAVAPALSERNALFLLAEGEIEPDVDREIPLFRRATEIAPNFEIAQYQLAYSLDMRFRGLGELVGARAGDVVNEYDKVLSINPGNIAAHAQQGYLYWLTEDLARARDKFQDGYEIKALARDTFVGVLSHGLARVAAEEGDFERSSDLYAEATAADPGIGAWSPPGPLPYGQYFEYMTLAVLKRYERFVANVERAAKRLKDVDGRLRDKQGREFSRRAVAAVQSWVRNDYGNACLNYFLRLADRDVLNAGARAYEKAHELDPRNGLVLYNLHSVCVERAATWPSDARESSDDRKAAVRWLEQAVQLTPTWPAAALALALSRLRIGQDAVHKARAGVTEAGRRRPRARLLPDPIALNSAPVSGGIAAGRKSDQGLVVRAPRSHRGGDAGPPDAHVDESEAINNLKNATDEFARLSKEASDNLGAIIQRTKLRPLSAALAEDFMLRGAEYVLRGQIVTDRLDDSDVSALAAWVRILAIRPDEGSSDAAERLAAYIEREYAPDDFAINTALQDMYRNPSPNDGAAAAALDTGRNQKIGQCRDRIEPVIRSWLERDPISYAALSWTPNRLGQESELVRVLDRARDRGPRIAWYHARIGDFYGQGNLTLLEKALAAYTYASELDPDNAEYSARVASAENAVGNVLYNAGDFEPSADRYRLAIKHNPTIAVFHGNLGGALQALGRMQEGEEAYRAAISRAPADASFENRLGNLYYTMPAYELAVDCYIKAIEKDGQTAVYHANLGGALRELKRWDESARAYRAAIALEEENASHDNALGNMFYAARKFAESAACYRAAIAKDANVAVYHSNLGGALRELRQTADAERAYVRATELEPGNGNWQNLLGNLYFDILETYDKALERYQAAIAVDAKQAVYHYNMAGALDRLDRWNDALRSYHTAIDLEPDNASIHNGFGFALIGRGEHARGVEQFERAVQLDPSNPVYHSNLARGLELLKKLPEALSAAEEGARLHPQNPEIAQVLRSLRQQPATPSQGQSRESA